MKTPLQLFDRLFRRKPAPDQQESPTLALKRIERQILNSHCPGHLRDAATEIHAFEAKYAEYYQRGWWVTHLWDAWREREKKLDKERTEYTTQLLITGGGLIKN